MRTLKLIQLYYYICQVYDNCLYAHCMRLTKNDVPPKFTDEELLTVYLFISSEYQPATLKHLHRIAYDCYRSWFPNMPGYERFTRRLNRISSCFGLLAQELCAIWLEQGSDQVGDEYWLLCDSFPVICCNGQRYGMVAPEITERGYNSTKGIHYWGLKIHVIALKTRQQLPIPIRLFVGPASEHDYKAQVDVLEEMANGNLSGDKAFAAKQLAEAFQESGGTLFVGRKDDYKKNEAQRKRGRAADQIYNTAVSKIKQPIEALFAFFERHTGIQKASLVRSTAGLTVHVMGKLAAAILSQTIWIN